MINKKLYIYPAIKIREGLCVELRNDAFINFLDDFKDIIFRFDVEIKRKSKNYWLICFGKEYKED